jgi:hypothetical protein
VDPPPLLSAPVTTFEQLDALSSRELHDRAIHRAERHLDVKFFWHLIKETPVAEAVAGDTGDARVDVQHASTQVGHAVDESPQLMDALRPLYIDYLLKQGDA